MYSEKFFPRVRLAQTLGVKAARMIYDDSDLFKVLNTEAIIVEDKTSLEMIQCTDDQLIITVTNVNLNSLIRPLAQIRLRHYSLPDVIRANKAAMEKEIDVFQEAFKQSHARSPHLQRCSVSGV